MLVDHLGGGGRGGQRVVDGRTRTPRRQTIGRGRAAGQDEEATGRRNDAEPGAGGNAETGVDGDAPGRPGRRARTRPAPRCCRSRARRRCRARGTGRTATSPSISGMPKGASSRRVSAWVPLPTIGTRAQTRSGSVDPRLLAHRPLPVDHQAAGRCRRGGEGRARRGQSSQSNGMSPTTRMTISRVSLTRPARSRTRAATMVSPAGKDHALAIGRQYCSSAVGIDEAEQRPGVARAGVVGVAAERRAGAVVEAAAEIGDRVAHHLAVAELGRIDCRHAADDRRVVVAHRGAAVAERPRGDDLDPRREAVRIVGLSESRAPPRRASTKSIIPCPWARM